jgi:hypothetical protein
VSLRHTATAAVLALALACSTAGPAEPGASAAGTPSGSGTPAAGTPSPSPSVSPSLGALEVEDGAALEPDRYAYSGFSGPRMTFEVGPGWVGGHVLAEFFDVQREAGGVLLGFADPTFVVGAEGDVDVEDLSPQEAIVAIASNPLLEAGRVGSTTIGGRSAFTVRGRPTTSVELFGGDEGAFSAEPGSIRLSAVDVDGELMLIVVSVWRPQPARVRRAIDALIASVRFDDSS